MTKDCEGCVWYWPDHNRVKCSNITKINRGGWNPIPVRRCEEYQSVKKEKHDTSGAGGVPTDKQSPGARKTLQGASDARVLHPRKTGKVSGRGGRD